MWDRITRRRNTQYVQPWYASTRGRKIRAAHDMIGPFGATPVSASVQPPAFLEEAVRAHRTTLLRESMTGEMPKAAYDPVAIRSATGIVLPGLQSGWKVVDNQIFPSAFGPSIELEIEAPKGRLSLFAVRPGSFAVAHVQVLATGDAQAAHWQIGDVAYALISESQTAEALGEIAQKLSRTLY